MSGRGNTRRSSRPLHSNVPPPERATALRTAWPSTWRYDHAVPFANDGSFAMEFDEYRQRYPALAAAMLDTDEGRARRGALVKELVLAVARSPEIRSTVSDIHSFGAGSADLAEAIISAAATLCLAARKSGGTWPQVSPDHSSADACLNTWHRDAQPGSEWNILAAPTKIHVCIILEVALDYIVDWLEVVNGEYRIRKELQGPPCQMRAYANSF